MTTPSESNRGKGVRRRATGASAVYRASDEEQKAVRRLVLRVAHNELDARDLLDTLGLSPNDVEREQQGGGVA